MADTLNFREAADTTMDVVVAMIGVALAGGIGQYILYQFNQGTNGTVSAWANLLGQKVGLVGTVLTMLLVGVIAVIGIALVNGLRNARRGAE